ncbi:unnamed protein product [Discula destructiva]
MPASASPPGPHKPTRLGVNPRRSHVPEPERKRCKTACNLCNLRRIRCSGNKPCDQCKSAQKPCEYPVVEKKVYVPESTYKELCANKDLLDACLQRLVKDPAARQRLLAEARDTLATGSQSTLVKEEEVRANSPAASSSTAAMSPTHYQQHHSPQRFLGSMDTAATKGSLLEDHHGAKRWLGGASGATFLDHLKKFMGVLKSSLGYSGSGSQFLASPGHYQTSDSRLLFTPAADNNVFPATSDIRTAGPRLAKVDEFLQGSTATSACGGIHYLGDFSFQTWVAVRSDHMRTPELAFYEAAFALGTIYSLTATNSRQDGQLGEAYFSNASRILGPPMEVSHYSMRDVATFGVMAMYMSEMNRRDSAYMYLSHAITICCMFGGLSGSSRELGERDKRIIWTLFCLTRDLSCLMGRPPHFPVEAFQLPYPTNVPGLPCPDGLIAHIELSKIADYIVSNTYATAPRKPHKEDLHDQDPPDQIGPTVRMLKAWRENLPEHLRIPFTAPGDESYEVDGVLPDRSLFMLHMKWNQLLILALRPLFFLAVKSAIGADFLNDNWRDVYGGNDDKMRESYIVECSAAARRNLCLGRYINKLCITKNNMGTTNGKLIMLDLHHIFNAAIVLLLYQMVNLNIVNTDNFGITAALRIFETEARNESLGGGVTGYASDCVSVLSNLAALVAQIRPLRFKDSEHVETGVDVSWIVGAPTTSFLDLTGGVGDGGCSTGTLGSPVVISTEQLAANLSLEIPYGPDGIYHQMLGAQQPVPVGMSSHTLREEFERWTQVDDGYIQCAVASLGGYTGL